MEELIACTSFLANRFLKGPSNRLSRQQLKTRKRDSKRSCTPRLALCIVLDLTYISAFSIETCSLPPPPPTAKILRKQLTQNILCDFGAHLRQIYIIIQELFCAIGGCKDLRLFHVELRKIYVTPENLFLNEFFCVIDTRNCRKRPENNSSSCFA